MEVIIHPPQRHYWLALVLSIFFSALTIGGIALALTQKYENEIYPGIKIADVSLAGLTKTQANNILLGKFKQTFGAGFIFTTDSTSKTILNEDTAILKINHESIVNRAFNFGRSGNLGRDYLTILRLLLRPKTLPPDLSLDKNLLKQKLQNDFANYQDPAQNAEILLTITNAQQHLYDLSFTSSRAGHTFNFDQAIQSLEQTIQKFENRSILLTTLADHPRITIDQALEQTDKIKNLLAINSLILNFHEQTWEIKWNDYANMLELALNDAEQVTIRLNPLLVKGQLESIAQTINQKATNAKFTMENGRVKEFQPSQTGQELDSEETYQRLNRSVIENNTNAIDLIVKITEPEITIENTNDLGVKEIIGIGQSNFSGSPQNRRHNIGVGAATLNGLLIKPGEEFSLVKALGKIDAEHGYKPELVIKKDKTTPEFGGGLCQIGTTIFRAALAAGLKITARTNHSYRVIYYEPAGTDATIYDPWPDFRFINDTGQYILIQTKFSGDNLAFEFWGTRDGRQIRYEGENQTADLKKLKPKIFNITKPGPAKEIETEELAPGEKKKIETAHNGADTVFTQYITHADGHEEKNVYKSHYIPWQEVWLIGLDQNKKSTSASSTDNPTATTSTTSQNSQ